MEFDIGVNHRIVGIKEDDKKGRELFYEFVDEFGSDIEILIGDLYDEWKELGYVLDMEGMECDECGRGYK